jgi:hypothetical protein
MCDKARILFAERNAFYELDLPPNPKAVYLALMHRANGAKKAFPGVPKLAHMTGLSERTVQRAIAWLESMKLLVRSAQIVAGRQTSNLYHLLFQGIGAQAVSKRHRGGRQGDARTKETSISEQQLPTIPGHRPWSPEIQSILRTIDPSFRRAAEAALSKAIDRGRIETTAAAYLAGVAQKIGQDKFGLLSGSPPRISAAPSPAAGASDPVRGVPIRISSPEVARGHLRVIGELLSGTAA